MEISINSGKLSRAENLVLYIYFSWHDADLHPGPEFISKIYEGTKETPLGRNLPVFLCSGAGHKELSSALAHLDISLHRFGKTSLRKALETWVLQCSLVQTESCKLCIEVRNQGKLEDVCLPTFRLHPDAPYISRRDPTRMVYKAIPKVSQIESLDKLRTAVTQYDNQ